MRGIEPGVGPAMINTLDRSLDSPGSDEPPPDYFLAIDGMMCQKNCGSTVEKALLSVPGVTKVIVSFPRKEASIWGAVTSSLLIDAVECVGFDATVKNTVSMIRLQPILEPKILECKAAKMQNLESSSNADKGLNSSVVTMNISGMSCTSCVRSLESGLLRSKGVCSVRVALLAEKAEIIFESQIISPEQIVVVISKLGYIGRVLSVRKQGDGAAKKELMFSVSGMSCANCAAKIERTLKGKPGVVDVGVSSITNKARVIIDGDAKGVLGPRDVMELVEALGFQCELVSGGGLLEGLTNSGGSSDLVAWSRLLFAALILGVPVMILHMSTSCFTSVKRLSMLPAACGGGVTFGQVVMVLLNVPLQFGVGYRFYRSALLGEGWGGSRDISIHFQPNMCIAVECNVV